MAAYAVLKFRHNDGSNQLGNLHPGAYSDYTGYVSKNTPDHIVDPNTGHWNLFVQSISQRDNLNLDAQVKLFFVLTNTVFDAGIAAWETKRFYNSERPITAIRFLFSGKQVRAWGGPHQGTQIIEGQNWRPYQVATIVTPAFPEFLSGHSTFSASAAEILKRFTGSDKFGASQVHKAGTAPFEPGQVPAKDISLSWATFSDAANQAGMSRRYGGIHFEQGDLMGRAMGRKVAAVVWDKAQGYIHGSS